LGTEKTWGIVVVAEVAVIVVRLVICVLVDIDVVDDENIEVLIVVGGTVVFAGLSSIAYLLIDFYLHC